MTQVAVKERGILFSAPMVRALLAGTKTQTRRIIKQAWPGCDIHELPNSGGDYATHIPGRTDCIDWAEEGFRCPYGQPGDRLWVRESFYAYGYWEKRLNEKTQKDDRHFVDLTLRVDEKYLYEYPAEFGKLVKGKMGWYKRPSIHMPRAASRLLLEITEVRVERVQDISEADAFAEGIERDIWDQALVCRNYSEKQEGMNGWFQMWRDYSQDGKSDSSYVPLESIGRESYRTLWQSINGPESWADNPWVWVVTFRVLESN